MAEQAERSKPRVGPKPDFGPWADPAARPLVRFEQVTKRFGPRSAVDRLSLDIFAGEFFALLGPSGCGKTTLLRVLAGFEAPDEGRILLDGADLAGMPPYRRPTNMMFQNYALFPHLTVEQNIAFGLRQEGMPRQQIEARVSEMLAPVKLYERPNSRYVADFVGDVNLLEGRLAATGQGESLIHAADGVHLRIAQPVDAPPGSLLW